MESIESMKPLHIMCQFRARTHAVRQRTCGSRSGIYREVARRFYRPYVLARRSESSFAAIAPRPLSGQGQSTVDKYSQLVGDRPDYGEVARPQPDSPDRRGPSG